MFPFSFMITGNSSDGNFFTSIYLSIYLSISASACAVHAMALSTTASGHGQDVYETDKAVSEYLLFHFGGDVALSGFSRDIAPYSALDFAQRTAQTCVDLWRKHGDAAVAAPRAFDVGCAVGGSSFELAQTCDAVVG